VDSQRYLDRTDLLNRGLDAEEADALLAASPLTGNDGRPVIEADRLDDLLKDLRQQRGEL
jgi:hypothetical protein